MPYYCYSTREGHTTERFFVMGKAPKTIKHGGKTAYRDIAAEHNGMKVRPGNWPMWSDAAGVNPDQIPEAVAGLEAAGLHAEYAPVGHKHEGCIKFKSPRHRKAICEYLGLYDRNAGYSDPLPVPTTTNTGDEFSCPI